ncbi:MAG: FtsH protease activity modulator HflK [Alphaproteobacteria bacterium]|jgi:membrane protease subunit HflK|nr:FtsH protease activity modulator HflK [Alphaproteobacteria bacterium]OJU55758.1 MAG: HflK protein [Alphaproteobacteria bacterium 62-8]MBN9556013.1 FtsH protease activity modulator HflK [Alphaproteobacteria bacterium]MBN9566847.1 FtsH protease activity modulator HflK [Alphaproteobacteria bacterium]MBN9577305.1 FtsH protease activity modulator HflK [Alphaproteobacteria bacterium]
MPWNTPNGNQGGNTPGGGRGPWGRGPSGGGPQPPDFEELLRRSQERLKRILPGGFGGRDFGTGGLMIGALVLVVVWLLSGVYVVSAYEQGVVLRFGKIVARTMPGINYHLPWPIETVYTPDVTHPRQISIGYRQAGSEEDTGQDVSSESLMLTGDENIVDINFTVYWVIKDAANFLFNVEDPNGTVKAVAESAMREVVGKSQIEPILTQDREPVQQQVKKLMQAALDSYGAGVQITDVKMQKADPPAQVIDAYRDVQAARADQERMRNEAEAYSNKIIPEARGRAARIVQEAQAYKQQVVAEASGEAKRFLSVYEEYRKAPDVTRERMYLETMSQILGTSNKVIVDGNSKGIVPYLPLPALKNVPSKTTSLPGPPGSTKAQDSSVSAGGSQ